MPRARTPRAKPAQDAGTTATEPHPTQEAGAAVATRPALLTDYDLYLFNEGSHARMFQKLGAHVTEGGVQFAVWAPNADAVSVIGDFNHWNPDATALQNRGSSGI